MRSNEQSALSTYRWFIAAELRFISGWSSRICFQREKPCLTTPLSSQWSSCGVHMLNLRFSYSTGGCCSCARAPRRCRGWADDRPSRPSRQPAAGYDDIPWPVGPAPPREEGHAAPPPSRCCPLGRAARPRAARSLSAARHASAWSANNPTCLEGGVRCAPGEEGGRGGAARHVHALVVVVHFRFPVLRLFAPTHAVENAPRRFRAGRRRVLSRTAAIGRPGPRPRVRLDRAAEQQAHQVPLPGPRVR